MSHQPPSQRLAYKMYRGTTIGLALTESLEEMIRTNELSADMVHKILIQFDEAINEALLDKVTNKLTVKGSITYRFVEGVWSFVVEDPELNIESRFLRSDLLKIVACENKAVKHDVESFVPTRRPKAQ